MPLPVRPAELPNWATDANYSTGPFAGQPTKLNPAAGVKAQGFYPEQPGSSRHQNWWQNNVGEWATYFDNYLSYISASAALLAFNKVTPGMNWFADSRFSQYGWGRKVGVIGVSTLSGKVVMTHSKGGSSDSIPLFTPATAPASFASFAQDETGSVIIGTGPEANQKAWRSLDGGLTWSEVALPGTIALSQEVLAVRNRFNGYFYIFRMSGGIYNLYRSTDDGASWTLINSALGFSGAHRLSVAFSASDMFVNANMNTLSTTYRSADDGSTFSNAFAPSSRYVNSVVEINGNIYALGYNSSTAKPYVAIWASGAWSQLAAAFPAGPICFTRFSTKMGPLIVALALDAFANTGSPFWMASRDNGYTWRAIPMGGAGYYDRYQSPSPGGVHVMITNSDSTMTLMMTEGDG